MEQKDYISMKMFAEAGEYWSEKLHGITNESKLPADFLEEERYAAGRLTADLPAETGADLIKMSKNNDLSLFVILLTALKILFFKLTGQEDITAASATMGKHIHKYNTLLVFRDIIYPRQTFRDLLMDVKNTVVAGYKHQFYPFDRLKDLPGLPADISLTRTILLVESIHHKKMIEEVLEAYGNDLTFSFAAKGNNIACEIVYNAVLFSEKTIGRFFDFYLVILRRVSADRSIKIDDIELITGAEKERIIFDLNDTSVSFPEHRRLHELVAEQAARSPDHIALTGSGAAARQGERKPGWIFLTYKELERQAGSLAGILIAKGMAADSTTAVMIEHAPVLAAGILAVLKAGGAYLPIDPAYPVERKEYMLNDSRAKLLITTPCLREEAVKLSSPGVEVVFAVESGASAGARRTVPSEPAAGSVHPVTNHSNLAYIIYTSGTTGRPKGVLVEHRGVVNMLLCRKAEYKLSSKDTALQLFSLAFDAFVIGLFTPLISGARVVFIQEEWIKDIERIHHVILNLHVSHLTCVPVLYRAIIENISNIAAAFLKVVTLGGDKLSPAVLAALKRKNPEIEIVNEYGVTEASVTSTIYRHQEKDDIIKVGCPIWNTRLYITDSRGKLQPLGISGEMCIAGTGLARGYLNNPGLTAEKFIRNPFPHPPTRLVNDTAAAVSPTMEQDCRGEPCVRPPDHPESNVGARRAVPSEFLYLSGDLARRLEDGTVEFFGRIDQQVKVRGYRVELAEIEARLLKHPLVKAAVVIPVEGRSSNRKLVAFFTSDSTALSDDSHTSQLWDYLTVYLPDYMIPVRFIQVEKIPLTPNGKVDRRALLEFEEENITEYVPPADWLEEKIAQIWAEVLELDKKNIGTADNFFELGGHSLNATIMLAGIHKAFSVNIPLAEIFEIPTITGLAQYIKNSTGDIYCSIPVVEKKEYYALSSAQKRLFIQQQMERDSLVYNIPMVVELTGALDENGFKQALHRMIRRHESLRTSFHMINEAPVQRIHDPREIKFEIEYYKKRISTAAAQNPASQFIDREHREEPCVPQSMNSADEIIASFTRPFDLAAAPLIRVGLIRLAGQRHILMLDIHHIIVDGTSMMIFLKELLLFYQDGETDLPVFRTRYRDFSVWQEKKRQSASLQAQEDFWLQQFNGEIPEMGLPLDYKRERMQTFAGSRIRFELSEAQAGGLMELAAREKTTMFILLLTVFNILLSKWSDREDIIVGSPIVSRRHADLEQVIGFFVNMLALRNYPKEDITFINFLMQVKERTLKAYENQEYQYDDLVAMLLDNRSSARNSLFDVAFAFQNVDLQPGLRKGIHMPGLQVQPCEYGTVTTPFDIILTAFEAGKKIEMLLSYKKNLFSEETMKRLSLNFKEIVVVVLEKPAVKIKEILISHDLLTVKHDELADEQGDFGW